MWRLCFALALLPLQVSWCFLPVSRPIAVPRGSRTNLCRVRFSNINVDDSNIDAEEWKRDIDSELLQLEELAGSVDHPYYSISSVHSQPISDPESDPYSLLNSRLHPQSLIPPEGSKPSKLPGDYGFDPLKISTRFDPFSREVNFGDDSGGRRVSIRPPGLVIRDYREAEIRHGRLAMLAAIFWPSQELMNNFFLPSDFSFSVVYGGPTLPFIPLIMMTAIFGLGYLDIFASEIRRTEAGEAYLPGECFWDPLGFKTNLSDEVLSLWMEREVVNGRAAMLAVAVFALEEFDHKMGVVDIGFNQLVFRPWFLINWGQLWQN